MIRPEPLKYILTRLIRPALLIGFLMLVSVTAYSQYESNDVVGNWEDGSSWVDGNIPNSSTGFGDQIDIYGNITRNGSLNIQFFSSLTIHDTLFIDGDLSVSSTSELTIGPDAVLIVNGNLDLDGLTIWGFEAGGEGTNEGDLVVKGDMDVAEEAGFDTQNGNTYVEGDTNDPGGNIEGDVQDEEDLADDNPDLYDDVYDDCDSKPAITLAGSNATGCPGSIATYNYTNSINGPDEYRIDFGDNAEGEDFSDLPYTSLSGGTISVDIPPTATSGTYQAVLKVRDIDNQCISDANDITLTVAVPSVNLVSSNREVCPEAPYAGFEYSAPINNPDQYSIDFDGTAEAEGFADVTGATLSGSPIEVSLPADPAPGVYNATLTVENTSMGCSGTGEAIAITVLNPPEPEIAVDGSSNYSADECFTQGHDLVLNGGTYSSYSWSISPPNNDEGNPLSKSGAGTQQVAYGNFTNPNATSQTYTVSLTVTNAASCEGEDTMDFILRRRPETGDTHFVPNDYDDE